MQKIHKFKDISGLGPYSVMHNFQVMDTVSVVFKIVRHSFTSVALHICMSGKRITKEWVPDQLFMDI